MRVAITGAKGQLGRSLTELVQSHELLLIDLPEHDVAQRDIMALIADFAPPR